MTERIKLLSILMGRYDIEQGMPYHEIERKADFDKDILNEALEGLIRDYKVKRVGEVYHLTSPIRESQGMGNKTDIKMVAYELSAIWQELTGKLPTLARYPLERALERYTVEQIKRALVWFLHKPNKKTVIEESKKLGCQNETKKDYKDLYFDFSFHFLPMTLLNKWVELSSEGDI